MKVTFKVTIFLIAFFCGCTSPSKYKPGDVGIPFEECGKVYKENSSDKIRCWEDAAGYKSNVPQYSNKKEADYLGKIKSASENKNNSSFDVRLDYSEDQCEQLGFKRGSKDFGNCVIDLLR